MHAQKQRAVGFGCGASVDVFLEELMKLASRTGVAVQGPNGHPGGRIVAGLPGPGEDEETRVRATGLLESDGAGRELLEVHGADIGKEVLASGTEEEAGCVKVGAAFGFFRVGDLVLFVYDRPAGGAVAGCDVGRFVRDEEGGAGGLIVLVSNQDDGAFSHNTGHTLEAGRGEEVERDYGNSELPQVFGDMGQRRSGASACNAFTPKIAVSWRRLRERNRVSEVADGGGSDANCGMDCGCQAVAVRCASAPELGVGVSRRVEGACGGADGLDRLPEKARDADLDILDETRVVGALVVPPVGENRPLHELGAKAGLGEPAHQDHKGAADAWAGDRRGFLRSGFQWLRQRYYSTAGGGQRDAGGPGARSCWWVEHADEAAWLVEEALGAEQEMRGHGGIHDGRPGSS